jgi:hypothetical protein
MTPFTISILLSVALTAQSFVLNAPRRNVVNRFSMSAANGDGDLLVRALKGEKVERVPVWLMRQV